MSRLKDGWRLKFETLRIQASGFPSVSGRVWKKQQTAQEGSQVKPDPDVERWIF